MNSIQDKLTTIKQRPDEQGLTIMILGLGSVGTYLLDYLVSMDDPAVHVIVVGRDRQKMEQNVNIVRVSALIRGNNRSHIFIEDNVDFEDVGAICDVIKKCDPDMIVNSSRAYPGLKYGSISWENVRAYGIWSPLAIHLTRNIMSACEQADGHAIVISTSYSDAVIPWLKSATLPYPDFGSGNLNHLVPRIQFAAAEMMDVKDFWNVDVIFAAGHFHDVCISKEGHTEGVSLPLQISYHGEVKDLDRASVFEKCRIPMPVDTRRNMMNASSNFRIISALIEALRNGTETRLFIPGMSGEIGGYPVKVGMRDGLVDAWIDDSVFSLDEMRLANKKSMYLDGIEEISYGTLIYTNELIDKAQRAFLVKLPKMVGIDEADDVAAFIIKKIIEPQLSVKGDAS